jgi:hypothetical protein
VSDGRRRRGDDGPVTVAQETRCTTVDGTSQLNVMFGVDERARLSSRGNKEEQGRVGESPAITVETRPNSEPVRESTTWSWRDITDVLV